MKHFDSGQIITILANIGVIASIVMLAIQIRDSNDQARVAIQTDYSSRRRTIPAPLRQVLEQIEASTVH